MNPGTWRDLIALLLLTGLTLGLGLGSRSPWWPAEAGIALAGSEMLANGQWQIPLLGGLTSAQPILPVWLAALAEATLGSVRSGFLVPSCVAALLTVALVWDLARRLGGREAGLTAALALLVTLQFGAAARNGSPDTLLAFLVTLSLYGLLRHLLIGPAWLWFVAGSAAAGAGMLTHSSGWLALLVLVPWGYGRARGWPVCSAGRTPWAAAAATFLVIAATPMILAMTVSTSAGFAPEGLVARTRGSGTWPDSSWTLLLWWLPLTALVFWLWPRWRDALRNRDPGVLLLGGWVVLAGGFLVVNTGGKAQGLLPLLPAVVLLASPWLPALTRRRAVRRTALGLALAVPLAVLVFSLWPPPPVQAAQTSGEAFPWPFVQWAVLPSLAIALLLGQRHALAAMVIVFCGTGVLLSTLGRPALDDTRSGREVIALAEIIARAGPPIGLLDPDPRWFLITSRPLAFAARTTDIKTEKKAILAWLDGHEDRRLLASATSADCFETHSSTLLGSTGTETWYLIAGNDVRPGCRHARDSAEEIIEWDPSTARFPAETSTRIP